MNIKLFGYSISLTVIILIGILYLIMVVNALSASCNREGMTDRDSYIANFVDSIEMIINKAELNGKPLTARDIDASRAQLDGFLRANPQDPSLLTRIEDLKKKLNQMQQSPPMPQIQPMPQIKPMPKKPPMPQIPPIPQSPPIPQGPPPKLGSIMNKLKKRF